MLLVVARITAPERQLVIVQEKARRRVKRCRRHQSVAGVCRSVKGSSSTARSVAARRRIMTARGQVEKTLIASGRHSSKLRRCIKASSKRGWTWRVRRRFSMRCDKSQSSRLRPLVLASRVGCHERTGSKQLVVASTAYSSSFRLVVATARLQEFVDSRTVCRSVKGSSFIAAGGQRRGSSTSHQEAIRRPVKRQLLIA